MKKDAALRWGSFAVLVVLIFAVWAGALNGELTYDDKVEVVGNKTIRTLSSWSAVVSYNASRPLVILTWALDWHFWGLDPLGYHISNVVVHCISAGLAFLFTEELLLRLKVPRARLLALLAVAGWALHPMTTEAVTYITGRSEALCAGLFAGTLFSWMRWRRLGGPFNYWLSFIAFLAAAATKEVAAVVPLLLLLAELVLPADRPMTKRSWAGLGLFFSVLLAGAGARKYLYGVFLTDQWIRPIGVQLRTQAEVVLRYLQLWILPVRQSVFHDHPESLAWSVTAVLALLALTALATAAVLLRKRWPIVTFAIGWFFIILLPSSSIVPLKETMAEHRAYMSGLAIFFVLAWLVRGIPLKKTLFGAVPLILVLGTATHFRNQLWNTEVTLWQDAAEKSPSSSDAWYGYGDSLRFARRFDESEAAFREADRLDPESKDAKNNLGIVLAEQGKLDEANKVWLELLRSHPTYCKAHNNIGWLYYRQQEWDLAIREFRSTLTWCPDDLQAHLGLGNIHYGPRKDVTKAIYYYERALQINPAFRDAPHINQRLLEMTW